jgi:phosphatidylglycerophosphate synthase
MTVPVLLAGVLGSGLLLAVLSVVSAETPPRPVPDVDGFLDRWSALHGDHDPRSSVWVGGWLRLTYRLARPLARAGAAPDVLTLWTAWAALITVALAAAGGRWPLAAALLVVLGGAGDSLDGAVAALTGRATRWGYVLDSLVDRVNDLLYVLALVLASAAGQGTGAAAPPAVGCALGFLLHDYLRARAGNAGAGEVIAVTLGERAHRIIWSALGLAAAGLAPTHARLAATATLWALLGFTLVGFVQLLVAVRRHLR